MISRKTEPEGTEVFKLLPSSDDLIEKTDRQTISTYLGINARTIAKFSSGNARVAIALAETVKTKETLGRLSDTDLFRALIPTEGTSTMTHSCV